MSSAIGAAVAAAYTEVRNILTAHERLVLAAIAALVLWCGVGKVENIIDAHDKKVMTVQQQKVAADAQATAANLQQAAQQAAQYQALSAQLTQQNAALEQSNVALAAALTKQQQVDKTLPPTDLAQHITDVAVLPPASLLPTTNGNFSLTLPGARQIAIKLDTLPVLESQLKNTQTEKDNTDKLLDASNGRVDILNKTVDGLKQQQADSDKLCKDQLKVQADNARKRERKIAVIAGTVGAILGQVVRHALGF